VEFAMATPLLLMMLGGAADLGLAQFYKTNLANAVAAGAQYAYLTGPTVTSANIQTVITDAMYLPTGVSGNFTWNIVAPRGLCVTGQGPSTSSTTAGSTCSDGSTAGTYVTITVTYTNTGIMGSFFNWPLAITETAWVRLN
jgi:Flp pilus assembly protein TadG